MTRLQGAAEWCYHSSQAGTPRKGDQPKDWRAPTQEPAPFAGTSRSGTFNFDLHGAFSEVAGTPRLLVCVGRGLVPTESRRLKLSERFGG